MKSRILHNVLSNLYATLNVFTKYRSNSYESLTTSLTLNVIKVDNLNSDKNKRLDMESEQTVQEEFSDLGIEVEDKLVLDELDVLAKRYNIDNQKLSCEYFSFNTKNKLGLKPPTLEVLTQFENGKLKNLRVGPRRPLDPIEGAENLPDVPDLGPMCTPVRLMASKRGVVTPESNPNKR